MFGNGMDRKHLAQGPHAGFPWPGRPHTHKWPHPMLCLASGGKFCEQQFCTVLRRSFLEELCDTALGVDISLKIPLSLPDA